MLRKFILLIALCAFRPLAAQEFTSGPQQVRLLELYTSEGCSSCPPADRWISGLKASPALWRAIVPVAFHVDYWDYIGWKDAFADPTYSRRQRTYQQQGHTGQVYTPQFVLNGQEWHGWRGLRTAPGSGAGQTGRLSLDVSQAKAELTFQPDGRRVSDPVMHFALLGFDYQRPIGRGENVGRTLQHDFVVLNHQVQHAAFQNRQLMAAFPLKLPADNTRQFAVAAWIAEQSDQRPIQAVGGWYVPQ